MEQIQYHEDKLAELILYIAEKTAEDETFGATKLNKALFYSDFLYYAETGCPITGADYQRLDWGPAPRRLLPVRTKLINSGAAEYARDTYLGRYPVKRLVPSGKRRPDLSLFSDTELRFVDEIVSLVSEGTAVEISMASHAEVGWQLAAPGEDIPYFTVWLSPEEPTVADRERARELAAKLLTPAA